MTKLLFSASFMNVLILGINFLFKIYLSYQFSKEDLGIFYTFIDLVSIGVMLFSGFKDTLIVAFDKKEFKRVIYWYSLSFLVGGGVIFFVVLFLYKQKFSYPLYLFIIFYVLNLLAVYFSYINSAFKNYKIMLFERLVEAIGIVGSFFVFYYFIHSIYALLCAFISGFIVRILFLKLNIKLKIKRAKLKRKFLKNSFIATVTYFFSGLFISMAGYLILMFDNKEFLGEWQVVVRSLFFSLVTIFVFPLNTYLFPYVSEFINKGKFFEVKRMEKRLLKYLFIFEIIILIGLFFTKYLVLIFPKEYKDSYIYLNLMLPFLPFIAYTTFALNIIKAFNKFNLALIVRVSGSLVFFVSVFFDYFFIKKVELIIYSFDLAFLVMAIMSFYFKRKLL